MDVATHWTRLYTRPITRIKIRTIMNETMKTILTRRSVKKYTDRMVSDELIKQVVEAGTYAPSGMNKQSAMIIAVTNRELRDRLSRINLEIITGKKLETSSGHGDPFYGAPVVLVVLADKQVGTRVYDGSLVMENMMLAAHSLGLGSCWIHRAKETFDSEEGREHPARVGHRGRVRGHSLLHTGLRCPRRSEATLAPQRGQRGVGPVVRGAKWAAYQHY